MAPRATRAAQRPTRPRERGGWVDEIRGWAPEPLKFGGGRWSHCNSGVGAGAIAARTVVALAADVGAGACARVRRQARAGALSGEGFALALQVPAHPRVLRRERPHARRPA